MPVNAAFGPSLPGMTHPRPAAEASSGASTANAVTASTTATPTTTLARTRPAVVFWTRPGIMLGAILGLRTVTYQPMLTRSPLQPCLFAPTS